MTFSHNFDMSSGDETICIENGDETYITNLFLNNTEADIKKGVKTIDFTRYSHDKYSDGYNEIKNKDILNALKVSAQLSQKNDENDLYNEKMASRLK